MWPVQTLTLLLCLTDDEQLFAQAVREPQPVVIEAAKPVEAEEGRTVAPFQEEVAEA